MTHKAAHCMAAIFITVAMSVYIIFPVYALGGSTANYGSVIIDGYFDDWRDKPHSYVTNGWQEAPDNQKRYASLFCDGEYVYFHIKMLAQWKDCFNGNQFHFRINDRYEIIINICTAGGIQSHPIYGGMPGRNRYCVRYNHDGSSTDWDDKVEGSEAFLYVPRDGGQDEFEMKVPLTAFTKKCKEINLNTIRKIEVWNPNVIAKQGALVAVGTSTGPIMGVILCMGTAIVVVWHMQRKLHVR